MGEKMSLLNLYEINSMELPTGDAPTVACRPSISWICLVGDLFLRIGIPRDSATIKSTKFGRLYFLELFFPHYALGVCFLPQKKVGKSSWRLVLVSFFF